MPSPFPGMDPFLERSGAWKRVHSCFPMATLEQVTPALPDGYYATPEVDIYIHEPRAEERRRAAELDAGVALSGGSFPGGPTAGGGAAVAARPVRRRLPSVYEETVRRVEVRTVDGDEVVTVIELLSPTNKLQHRDAYETKRYALLESPAHLVEIDLLRAGRPFPPAGPVTLEEGDGGLRPTGDRAAARHPGVGGDYLVMVSRAEDRPEVDLYPVALRGPLPVVPVPLRGGASVRLDLRRLLDDVWAVSRFEQTIYRFPPDPPLAPADAAWAADILRAAGLPLPPDFPPAAES